MVVGDGFSTTFSFQTMQGNSSNFLSGAWVFGLLCTRKFRPGDEASHTV